MRHFGRALIAFACATALALSTASAHSGRTDSSGGHKDNKNKSGLGSYHYHCGGYPPHLHTGGYCPYTDVLPSSVKMTVEKKTLSIGETVSISVAVSPSNACNTSVSLESSDPNVVRLRGDKAEAVGYGTATITATSFNGKSTSVKITVKEITAEQVTIGVPENITPVYIGQAFQLTANILPENTDNKSIKWASDDQSIAAVSQTGQVTPIAVGEVSVTATTSNGVTAKYTFQVHEKAVEAIAINDHDLSLFEGTSRDLSADITPTDATDSTVNWTSSDPEIAEVTESGVLTALRSGTAVITAAASNGLSDSITVDVTKVISVDQIEIVSSLGDTLKIGEVSELSAVVSPADATYPDITWETSDPTVATIDASGRLEALADGQVVVTARSEDGFAETLTITVSSGSSVAVLGGAAALGVGGLALLKKKRR